LDVVFIRLIRSDGVILDGSSFGGDDSCPCVVVCVLSVTPGASVRSACVCVVCVVSVVVGVGVGGVFRLAPAEGTVWHSSVFHSALE